MRNVARITVIMGSMFGLAVATGAVAMGCGGDDTAVPGDSGKDTTTDSPVDTGTDSPADNQIPDAGNDVGDAPADIAVDSANVADFPNAVLTAFCARLGDCCYPGDAAAWDPGHCENTQAGNPEAAGSIRNLISHVGALKDGGPNVTFNAAKAQACLQLARNYDCNITAAQMNGLRDQCYGALQGKIALNGTGCTDTIECAAGYCVPGDGGPGTCSPLVADGGACNLSGPPPTYSEDCTYRGTAGAFCDDDPLSQDAAAGVACTPQLPNGAECIGASNRSNACQSGLCDPTLGCVTTAQLNDAVSCALFTKDGG